MKGLRVPDFKKNQTLKQKIVNLNIKSKLNRGLALHMKPISPTKVFSPKM